MSIAKPGVEELKAAFAAAEAMREAGEDPHHVALSLHFLYDRCKSLESLLQVTDRYLRFGMPEHELSAMRRQVERLRENALSAEDSDEVDSTLPI